MLSRHSPGFGQKHKILINIKFLEAVLYDMTNVYTRLEMLNKILGKVGTTLQMTPVELYFCVRCSNDITL